MIFITGIRFRDDGRNLEDLSSVRWVDLETRETGIEQVEVVAGWIRSGLLVRIHNPQYGDPQVEVISEVSRMKLSAGCASGGIDLLLGLSEF